MKHFRRAAVIGASLTATLLLGTLLSGCATTVGAAQVPKCLPTGSATSSVHEAKGTNAVTFSSPLSVQRSQATVLKSGHGNRIGTQQIVSGSIRFYNAKTGDELSTDSTSGSQSFRVLVGAKPTSSDTLSKAMFTALACARTGERSVFAAPKVQVGSKASDTAPVLGVMTVKKHFSTRAQGRVIETHRGFPAVVRNQYGQPGVSAPTVAAPSKLRSQVVVEGSGKRLTGRERLIVQCTAVTYSKTAPTLAYSTWENSTVRGLKLTSTSALRSLSRVAFAGKRLGSQVVVIGPYVSGACDDPSSTTTSAPASSMVYVFDLLGTV